MELAAPTQAKSWNGYRITGIESRRISKSADKAALLSYIAKTIKFDTNIHVTYNTVCDIKR